ncbi:hypothetical protein JT31_01760 [Cedecea neteri]|uniref:Late control protein D n=1 Tax=Cedecea neteri TaxID=158822 RepID=A0A089PYY8_9ENTR|nr:contractile injection system protein, VgrG/Pvc8 family [Cedecea neteri]AIR03394.1 hypothetical protein JT31_01760 [Cedecea neteri]
MEYKPTFTLTAEGKDITQAIARGLSNIKLTDYGGATGKSDTLDITLYSETLTLPKKGARLRLGLGFNDKMQDKGWFVVSKVQSSGPPRQITISATAAPMNSAKQSGDVTSQKTRSFDDVTLGDIVKTLATDNGLQAKIAEALSDIKIAHIDQVRESDAALLSRLAKQYDAVSKPSGGYWLFLPQGDGTTVSGKQLASITITPDKGGRWNYIEGERDGAAKGSKSGKVSVNYFDPSTGETKTTQTEHPGGSDKQHPYTQPSKDAAQASAKAKATQMKRNGRKMSITMPCRPSLLPITAESRVTTRGFGVREDHTWLTESVSFSLSTGGMTVDFSLATDIKPQGKKGKEEKKSGPDYFS